MVKLASLNLPTFTKFYKLYRSMEIFTNLRKLSLLSLFGSIKGVVFVCQS